MPLRTTERDGAFTAASPKLIESVLGALLSGYCTSQLSLIKPIVSDGPKTDETCRFENRVLAGGSKTPSEGCSDGGVRLDWFSVQGGLIWSLVR